jgi:hypothetical protein
MADEKIMGMANEKIITITTGHDFDMKTDVDKACDFIKSLVKDSLSVYPFPDCLEENANPLPPKYKVALNLNLRFH